MPQFDQSILLPELSWLFGIFVSFYLFLVIFNKKKILKSFYYNKSILKYLLSISNNVSNYLEYCSKQYSIRLEKYVQWKLKTLEYNIMLNNLNKNIILNKLQNPIIYFFKIISFRKDIINKIKI